MKCESYMLQDRKLYNRINEGIYLKFLGQEEVKEFFKQFHDRYSIGHGLVEATTHMLLRLGYFWPMIFKDTFEHVHTCHICQTSANRERHPTMSLQLVFEVCPFAKWRLDFIGH